MGWERDSLLHPFTVGMELLQCWGGDVPCACGKLALAVGISCRGLSFLLCQVRMRMGGEGQFSGTAIYIYGKGSRRSCGLEAALRQRWGPLPLNYEHILPCDKSTLCSGSALPPRLLEMQTLLPTATFSKGRPSQGEKLVRK